MKIINGLEGVDFYEAIVFFDLEYTCWWDNNVKNNWLDVKRPPEVIQLGFAYYDKLKDKINSVFSSYVKPKINPVLSNYCKRLLDFPRKNGHPNKLELHLDNTPKGFFDSRRSVFSVDCKRFQYTQRWPDGLDLCCEKSLGIRVLSLVS